MYEILKNQEKYSEPNFHALTNVMSHKKEWHLSLLMLCPEQISVEIEFESKFYTPSFVCLLLKNQFVSFT